MDVKREHISYTWLARITRPYVVFIKGASNKFCIYSFENSTTLLFSYKKFNSQQSVGCGLTFGRIASASVFGQTYWLAASGDGLLASARRRCRCTSPYSSGIETDAQNDQEFTDATVDLDFEFKIE